MAVEVCDVCGNETDWEARRSDADRIRSLMPGDFFHARGMVCLVTEVEPVA